jgi:uncharacterized membrane protein YfcA
MILWLQVFLALVVIDILYAVYTKQVVKNKPAYASLLATGIYVINAIITINFVIDPWLLIPAGLGAFVGTYIGVKINISVV